MRSTTGQMAYWAALGADFLPVYDPADPGGWVTRGGVDQGDGTFVTVMRHADGRTLTVVTGRHDGWQRGRLVRVDAGGEWRGPMGAAGVARWQDVRRLLADHDPGREHPYCGGAPIRQPRALDGRERDILFRILSDIRRAVPDPEAWQRLNAVVHVDQAEIYRLLEMRAVLDPRDD